MICDVLLFAVECAPGTYYVAANKTCEYCPSGEYQTNAAQTECMKCPNGTTTETYGSFAEDECFGKLHVLCAEIAIIPFSYDPVPLVYHLLAWIHL